jgi:hypothetical protein
MRSPLFSLLLGILLAPSLIGCGDAAEVTVLSSKEIAVLPQSSAISGRDGGASALAWGKSIWSYGDTVLSIDDEQGTNWHHNSFSFTEDLDAADGIDGFAEPLDSKGAPGYLVAPTEEEEAFNKAHRGDPCAEEPCGARWAAWPGPPLFDAKRDRSLIVYGLIYAEPGDFNFHGVGQGIAVWKSFDAPRERPIIDATKEHPTLLFQENEPSYGLAPVIKDDMFYNFACSSGEPLSPPCSLARAPLESVLDRSTWEYWDGDAWSRDINAAEALFSGAPILSVAWNAHLARYTAVYSEPLSNDVSIRTAPDLWGPWSDAETLFVADRKSDEGTVYDAYLHGEYEEDGGRVIYVSHSRPTGVGWFGAEIALVRVELE